MWTKSDQTYVTEASDLRGSQVNCPQCSKPILIKHKTKEDYSGEDLAGTHFVHPCGAKLLVIND